MKNLWRSITTDNAASRLAEDVLYTVVYEEIENGQIDKAAQARAIAEGGENEGAVRAAYIKHRIARMRAEIEITTAQAVVEEKQKQLDVKIEKQRIKRKQIEREISDFLFLCFIVFVVILIFIFFY